MYFIYIYRKYASALLGIHLNLITNSFTNLILCSKKGLALENSVESALAYGYCALTWLCSRIHGDVMYKVKKCIGRKDLTCQSDSFFSLHIFDISFLINNLMIYHNYAWSTYGCNPPFTPHVIP
jgi:hypothetical protein